MTYITTNWAGLPCLENFAYQKRFEEFACDEIKNLAIAIENLIQKSNGCEMSTTYLDYEIAINTYSYYPTKSLVLRVKHVPTGQIDQMNTDELYISKEQIRSFAYYMVRKIRDYINEYDKKNMWIRKGITRNRLKTAINAVYGKENANKQEETNINNQLKYAKVIFHNPATIILWEDGTKTVVKCQKGEPFDPEKGMAMCFMKKALGNKYDYYHKVAKELKSYEKDQQIKEQINSSLIQEISPAKALDNVKKAIIAEVLNHEKEGGYA